MIEKEDTDEQMKNKTQNLIKKLKLVPKFNESRYS